MSAGAMNMVLKFREEAERWLIEDALIRCNRNMRAVARDLHCNRAHLYKRIKRLGIVVRPAKVYGGPFMTPEFRRFLGSRASA